MKILAITFSSGRSGGANKSFLMVIEQLRNLYGHEIFTVIPEQGGIEEDLIKLKMPYTVIPLRQPVTMMAYNIKDIVRKLRANYIAFCHWLSAYTNAAKLKKQNFDIVYINGSNQLCGYYLSKALKIPFVCHFRGASSKENYFVYNQKKLFNDKNGKIIAISDYMRDKLPEILGINKEQIVLVHNGIEWHGDSPSPQNRDNGIHCVLCGRIIWAKGHMDAIEALHILKKQGIDNVYLHIAGSLKSAYQPYLDKLNERIGELGIGDRVIFEDEVTDMPAFRHNMNIELVCSVCEPFGRVTVEGMQSGLVVIGANTGGTLDIIEDNKNGLLYRQGNPEDLAEKMRFVIENEQTAIKLASEARKFAKTHFTMEQNVESINRVLVEQANKKYI